MTGTVVSLPTPMSVDAYWLKYQALVKQATAAPELWADRAHVETLTSAFHDFQSAYLALEKRHG